jgi:hypothetical protein
MATIRIVGEILNIQQVSRYENDDLRLIPSQLITEDFGDPGDYIEFVASDIGGNLLNINYNYSNFKSPNTSFTEPNGTLPVIEIDPILDIQNLGYSSGEFLLRYNIFTNKISDADTAGLFLKEISADRTEVRVGSTVLSNEEIENSVNSLISESSGSTYFVDYILNFSNNIQAVAVNIALNRQTEGYEILFKLYQPLPDDINEKSNLWVVREKVNPYTFNINLDKLIIPDPGPQLRGPNFDIEIPNQNNIASSYQNYNNLISNLQNVSSSYQQLLSLITSQSIDINTDYTNFNNFIFFSSAKQRVIKFYEKVKQIENAQYNITNVYTPITASNPSAIKDYNLATASINNTIANFDGFEYYLYFESGSTLTSSVDFSITPYPKSGSLKPFKLWSTGSVSSSIWYDYTLTNAEEYDDYNQNNLIYTLPSFITDDSNNASYVTFINMVGHYFDNIWIYLQAVTDINLANNNLEKGVSKDLVYTVLQSLGTKLYNKYGNSENDIFLIGQNSGSVNFDNNFTPTGSYLNNIPRKDLLAETYKRIYHNLPLLLKTKGTSYGLQTLISTFGITGSILNVKEYGGNLKINTLDEYNTDDKVRIYTNTIHSGNVLSPHIRLQTYPSQSTEFRTNDYHYVDISFSPETQIDNYVSASISSANPSWSLDDYIGNPGQLYSNSYIDLNTQKNTYYNFTASYMDYAGFIRLIQFFDNSLFKMLKDFIPARANLSTGITINSPVLERNKFVYANPSPTSKIEVNEGTMEGPIIGTEYTDIYQGLTGSRAAYYTGEFSGSIIEYGDDWIERNFNPYLHPTASLTSHDINVFNHSEFNVLLNNVSASRLSNTRRDIEFIYGTTGSILSPAYLQDTNESLTTYNRARYEGAKVSSLLYSTYTSASTDYSGDSSYGKTAAINKDVRQIGLFTEIVSSSLLPGRNRVALKYLVDEFGGLTELNQRNTHWEDIQRTFIAGNYLNVSQFDNQKSSNQKSTDGNKLIFDSGYSYNPILYFAGCSLDSKIYFENQKELNSYLVTANNGNGNRSISGSGIPGIPVEASTGRIYNIFNNEIDPNNIFNPGTISTFPTYSVIESGDYKVEATFDLTVNMPLGGNSTWVFRLLKNGVAQVTDEQSINIVSSATASAQASTVYSPSYTSITSTAITTNKPILIFGTNYPAGSTLYKYDYNLATSSAYPPELGGCDFSFFGPWYSIFGPNTINASAQVCTNFNAFDTIGTLYLIPGIDASPSEQTKTFSINRSIFNPITDTSQGDKLTLEFSQSYLSTNNYTASLSLGSLNISSLAVATGYASAACPYFSSSSLSASRAAGDRQTITFSSGLSNFPNNGYQFIPNPLTGSINSLYAGDANYGDVDYPFNINRFDKIITYLSDNSYIESNIISSSFSGSLFQIHTDIQLSDLYINNLMSGSYQRFLILSRQQDETSTYLIFKKREGSTSYGFTIPQNIAPDVLANIDTITKEVKQKLLSDQSAVTINTF